MKKYILSTILFVCSLLSCLPVSAEVLRVESNYESGISNATHTATLDDGTVLGFHIYASDSYAFFVGAITETSEIHVPDSIVYNYNGEDIHCYISRLWIGDFEEAPSGIDLYLPSTLKMIDCNLTSQISNLHLASTSVVDIHYYTVSSSTTVWVPQEAYSSYGNSSDWYYYEDIRYEGWEPHYHTVTVNTPGSFGDELLKVADQWNDVEDLTVIGSLNDDDIKYFSRMINLRKLDLSKTDITYIGSCNSLKWLKEVILPETVTSVSDRAFYECSRIKYINLPNVVSVGVAAFYNCSSLASVELPMAQNLGQEAFRDCSSLTSVELPMAQSIGTYAFYYCTSLTSAELPKAQSIGYSAFSGCSSLTSAYLPVAQSIEYRAFQNCPSLTSVELPMAQSIGTYAFSSCTSLTSVDLPMVQSIEESAFESCYSLNELVLSSRLQNIEGGYTFSGCNNIKDVYCYAVVPPTTRSLRYCVSSATLHVPEMSLSTYKLNEEWYNFASVVPLEGDVEDISINDNFAIYDYNGISDNPNLSLTFNSSNENAAHLTVAAGSELAVNDYVQDVDLYLNKYTTLMSKNPITANTVTMNITVPGKRWNFISFPFDVKVGDIELPEGTLWVIRRYSGENRAAMTGDTWQNMTDDMILKAGEGYILNCLNEEYSYYGIPMTVHAVDNGNKNNIFATADVTKTLEEYPSESANNSSWNLVGNPYPTYFNIKSIAHEAPITIWNGSGYTAYSTEDDDYMIAPFSAFFVQCPEDASSMTFAEEGRSHEKTTTDANYKPRHQAETSERVVMNINLSGNDYTDRARLVLNEKAKAEYEIARDASKFMSSNAEVPQIYVIDNDQRYSIDERPLGNGTFAIGTYFGSSADYTISLDVKNYGGTVTLTDKATGISTDMTQYDYTFTAEAGTYNNRFMLTVGADVTAINGVENGKNTHSVYNVGGVKVDDNARGLLIIDGKKVMK